MPPSEVREHVQDLLFDLRAAGLSNSRIAKLLQVHRTTVRKWFASGSIKHHDYVRLAALHSDELRPAACLLGTDAQGLATSFTPPA
jgi:hypothetical protein